MKDTWSSMTVFPVSLTNASTPMRAATLQISSMSHGALASLFGVPPASPRIFSDLNGLFLLAVGLGYYFPWRDPVRYRGYMWVMGPLLKGAGALTFILDYVMRGSPRSFLLFAASDLTLALLTLVALCAPTASTRSGTKQTTSR